MLQQPANLSIYAIMRCRNAMPLLLPRYVASRNNVSDTGNQVPTLYRSTLDAYHNLWNGYALGSFWPPQIQEPKMSI